VTFLPILGALGLLFVDKKSTKVFVQGATAIAFVDFLLSLPLFDGGFTGADGVRGKLGPLGGGAAIGMTEIAPNTAAAGALMEARRQNRHQAIVVATRGGTPGLCPSNADNFLKPFGPPVVQVSSEAGAGLTEGAEVQVTALVKRARVDAVNVTARIRHARAQSFNSQRKLSLFEDSSYTRHRCCSQARDVCPEPRSRNGRNPI